VPRARMECALASESVPQPCFVWPETLYSRPVIKLPHNSSCSPFRSSPETKTPWLRLSRFLNQGAQRRRISPHLFGPIRNAPGASILTGQSKYSVCWNGNALEEGIGFEDPLPGRLRSWGAHGGKSASPNNARKPWPQYGSLNAYSRTGRNPSDYVDLGPAFAETWPSKQPVHGGRTACRC
jgi:hypothetical protein